MEKRDKVILTIIAAICGVLQILFLAFKITDIITWHWALVFLPLIIPVGFFVALTLVLFSIIFFTVPWKG